MTTAPPPPSLHACAACQRPLGPVRWACASCQAPLHAECQAQAVRCPAAGCAGGRWREVDRRPRPGERLPLAWIGALVLGAVAVGGASLLHRTASARVRRNQAPVPAVAPTVVATGQWTADLSHVRVGEEWVFQGTTNGVQVEQVYEVVAVQPGIVRCLVVTRMDVGNGRFMDTGQPAPFDWHAPQPGSVPMSSRFEEVTAAGTSWLCEVVDDGNGTKTWIPHRGGGRTFPFHVQREGPGSSSYLVDVRASTRPQGGR